MFVVTHELVLAVLQHLGEEQILERTQKQNQTSAGPVSDNPNEFIINQNNLFSQFQAQIGL